VIRVTARSGAYDVHCRWGALGDLGALMRDAGLSGSAFAVTDSNVGPQFGERALAVLRAAGFEPALFTIPAGESSKSLDTVREVYDWLLDHRAERGSALVALGGGVVGDLTGFVAATYLRGVPFVPCPTSLLAMVDASIGGKVGVDHPRGKNLIGAFYPPRLVVQDTSLLAALPSRSLREGFAEVIKHGLIMDPAMLDVLEGEAKRLLAVEPDLTTEIVVRNAALKAKVVTEDEREGGLRAILNYGHTIGHAIEAVTAYGPILHGEAISTGMMAAAEIGRRMGVTPAAIVERQRRIFELYGLSVRRAGLDPKAVLAATRLDKKVAGRKLRWVLLEDAGRPVIRDDVPDDVVLGVLRDLFAG
jgi:3-dehydroquinate synthase